MSTLNILFVMTWIVQISSNSSKLQGLLYYVNAPAVYIKRSFIKNSFKISSFLFQL